MEKYNIIKIDNNDFNYLVIANNYENPINILLNQGVPFNDAKVLFDLTLIYGINFNRYVEAYVKNNKIDLATIKPISKIDTHIEKIFYNYFLENKELVENSILPNATKYYILHHI